LPFKVAGSSLKIKNRLPVEKRFRFIESKQPIRLNDGTEAYETEASPTPPREGLKRFLYFKISILTENTKVATINSLPFGEVGGASFI
jgi:hypothetical protein